MNKSNDTNSGWHFPADLLGMFILTVLPIVVATGMGFLFAPLFRARSGDPTVLYVAIALGAIGIVLLCEGSVGVLSGH